MKKYFFNIVCLLTLFIGLSTSTGKAQTSLNLLVKDPAGRSMLLGACTRAALQDTAFNTWFNKNYNDYTVDSFTCNFIKPLLAEKQVTIFMGTWCGDSRREVPRVLKILDCCGFPESQLKLIMVNYIDTAYKQSPGHEERGKNIVRVPTIIISQNKDEMGRIIEFPVVSLEKDLLSILRKEQYRANYTEAD